jgi:DNA-binding response OmpR family regulator
VLGPKLLVIDDDPSIRNLFAKALRDIGEVDVAGDGMSALAALGRTRYACIVLDLHMPGVDGFFLLKVLSERPGLNQHTPICVATADTSDDARIRALKTGTQYLIHKPVQISALRALVRGAVSAANPK